MDLMEKLKSSTEAYLILADGTVYQGYSLGAKGTTIGEVVFTTGMTGYQGTLTDPSYYGQIVTQTFPLIGNYGTNAFDVESSLVWMQGYIVRDWCEAPSNFRSELDISRYLKDRGIVGLWGIDTRALTRKIREEGVMNGAITTEFPANQSAMDVLLTRIREFNITGAIHHVSCRQPEEFPVEDPKCKVALLDYGYKRNLINSLHEKGCSVVLLPGESTLDDIQAWGVDGVMLSNGPGDPAENKQVIENLKEIFEKSELPVFGICLGHQVAALAMGAKTEKMKYGHRGANQPVVDTETGKLYVTNQNHGYAVVNESVTEEIGRVSHENVNDHTCEGIVYKRPDTFTVQFHPEADAAGGGTSYLFDQFVDCMVKEGK